MRSFALHSYAELGGFFILGVISRMSFNELERSWILRMRLAALACSQQDIIESHQSIERVGIPSMVIFVFVFLQYMQSSTVACSTLRVLDLPVQVLR